jgi:catechol 2,3-dioxygenase-like lactoylglutathione lyase family enzyme
VTAIARISRVVADLDRAEAFYQAAMMFRPIRRAPVEDAVLAALGTGPAEETVLRLGSQDIALVRFASLGRRYPPDSRSNDLWFQHLAIVVSDMDAAYAHLSALGGWQPISEHGPETLPPENEDVRAFKFRDPDGHPLELIWFPPGEGRDLWRKATSLGPFLGVDHSALAVASTSRAVAFYRALGFTVSARSLNHGPAQSRLDGLADANVQVTGLRPATAEGAGLELLAYRPPGRTSDLRPNDIATDWVTLTGSPGASPTVLRDPDRHMVVVHGEGTAGSPA